jgi:diguanylate cyclase (GGDEF)-like protein/PAS domain S-box-containing protein
MMPHTAPAEAFRRAAQAAALGLAYFVTAALTVRFTRFEGGVAFIWAASGLLLGTLVLVDRRRWPELIAVCGVAGVIVTCLFGLGPRAAVPLTAVNLTEAVLGAWLLRRFCPACTDLKSVGEIGVLIVTAGIAVPGACAFFGAAVAAGVAGVAYWPNWLAWYTGHALGTVAIAPLVMLVLRGEVAGWVMQARPSQRWEAAVLLTLLAATTAYVFTQTRLPLLFLPFLPMMIAVFRLGRLGATASLILIGVIGSVLTTRELGPVALIQGGSGLRAQFLQFYLATAVLMVLPAASDLKRRKRTVEELEEQAVLHRLILDRTGDVVIKLALDGRIRFASPTSTRVLGMTPEVLVGTMPHALIHPDDLDRVIAVQRQAVQEPDRTFTVDYRVVIDGREIGWFESHSGATLDDQDVPSGVVIITRDVTERKSAEISLSNAAYTDPLTGVANRRAFDAALAARLGTDVAAQPGVLAMFDLDHFKSVNDTHGHAAGDQVLRAFAAVLRGGVREGDMVARLGGEEFAAIIKGDLDAARLVCERVRTRLAALDVPMDNGATIRVTVSAGIAALPPRGSAAGVLAAADAALYRAKADGRNRLATAP